MRFVSSQNAIDISFLQSFNQIYSAVSKKIFLNVYRQWMHSDGISSHGPWSHRLKGLVGLPYGLLLLLFRCTTVSG